MIHALTRLIALVVLLSYSLSSTALWSMVVVTAAEFDPAHELRVEMHEGQVVVVLHHPQQETGEATHHEHEHQGAVSLFSCACAVDGHGDHIIEQNVSSAALRPDSAKRLLALPCAFEPTFVFRLRNLSTTESLRRLPPRACVRNQRPMMSLGTVALLI